MCNIDWDDYLYLKDLIKKQQEEIDDLKDYINELNEED